VPKGQHARGVVSFHLRTSHGRIRKLAAELVELAPDVILSAGSPSVAALQQATPRANAANWQNENFSNTPQIIVRDSPAFQPGEFFAQIDFSHTY